MGAMSHYLADLHEQVACGASGEPPPSCTRLDLYGIYRDLGCLARSYVYSACPKRIEHPSVKITPRELNGTDTGTTVHTTSGIQVQAWRRMTSHWHRLTLKRQVETEDELKVATWREETKTEVKGSVRDL